MSKNNVKKSLLLSLILIVSTYFGIKKKEPLVVEVEPTKFHRRKQSLSDFPKKPSQKTSPVLDQESKERNPAAHTEFKKLQELKNLAACTVQSNECPFSNEDPRSFDLKKGAVISYKISELVTTNNHLSSDEKTLIAIEFLKYENDFVRSSALTLLKDLPPQNEYVKPLLNAISNSNSATFLQQAMIELAKYAQSDISQHITNSLIATLRSGPLNCADTVAKNISPFLNQKTIDSYQKTLAQLPDFSLRHDLLKQKLRRYNKSLH